MKNVTFYLGPAINLSQRQLIITRMPNASDGTNMPSATSSQNLGGSTENATVALPDNTIWQATLQDTKATGEVGRKHVLNFHTGSLQFPGPATNEGHFYIYSMEDLSSSSSSSSQSSSSSSSVSSSSSSSQSSSSSSSTSSQSSSSSQSSASSVSSSQSSQS